MIGKLTVSRYPDKLHAELFTGTTKICGTIFTPIFFSDGYVAYLSVGIYVSD